MSSPENPKAYRTRPEVTLKHWHGLSSDEETASVDKVVSHLDAPAFEPLDLPARSESVVAVLGQLAELIADALVPRLAAELTRQTNTPQPTLPSRRLLTLAELIELLPAGKSAKTWRGWLYQHTRLGNVPGCHKVGNRLFFDPELTLAWILNGAIGGQRRPGLDLPTNQSLDAQAMRHQATQPRQLGGDG